MTNEEAIEFAKEQLEIFGKNSTMYEFLEFSIKALEERPKGKWIESKEHFYTNESCKEWTNFYCSECDVPSISPSNFCPNCGANMVADLYSICKHGDNCERSDKGISFANHSACWKFER